MSGVQEEGIGGGHPLTDPCVRRGQQNASPLLREQLVFTDAEAQLYYFSVEGNVVRDCTRNPPEVTGSAHCQHSAASSNLGAPLGNSLPMTGVQSNPVVMNDKNIFIN